MKRILMLLACVVCLFGCNTFETTPEQIENAEVIQLSYIPSSTSTVSGLSYDMSGSGGLGIVSGDSTTPEVWAVVLRCETHKKTFALKNKELYSAVKVGDKIKLYYYDVLEVDEDTKAKTLVDSHTNKIEVDQKTIKRR